MLVWIYVHWVNDDVIGPYMIGVSPYKYKMLKLGVAKSIPSYLGSFNWKFCYIEYQNLLK